MEACGTGPRDSASADGGHRAGRGENEAEASRKYRMHKRAGILCQGLS
jgi:hypothetical protein